MKDSIDDFSEVKTDARNNVFRAISFLVFIITFKIKIIQDQRVKGIIILDLLRVILK